MPNFRQAIVEELDTILAATGAIGSAGLTLWLLTTTSSYLFPIVGGLSFLACTAYLAIKRGLDISALLSEHRGKLSTYLLLNISFFLLITGALLVTITRAELYSTPPAYFILLTLAAAVLAAEILLLPPRRGYAYIVLLKTMLLALTLIWVPQVIFPSLLGIDPFFHGQFTQSILSSGHIPTGEPYSPFPVMHLFSGSAMLLTELDYKTATLLFTGFAYIIIILPFVFLLGRSVYGAKVGLLAALLLTTAALFVHSGWWMVPNVFAVIFLPALAYLFLKIRIWSPFRATILAIFLLGVLILTHTLGALSMAMILFLFWVGLWLYNRVFQSSFTNIITAAWEPYSGRMVTFTMVILFAIAMFSWWLLTAPEAITTLEALISSGFSRDISLLPPEESTQYALTIPTWENLLRVLSYAPFWAISFIGALAAFSTKLGSRHSFLMAFAGLAFLSLGFFSLPLDLGTLPQRWQFMALFWLAIPAALGLMMIAGMFKEGSKRVLLLPIMVAALTFISITSPVANTDNAIWSKNTTIRFAFTQSELSAYTTIGDIWEGRLAVDPYTLNYFRFSDMYTFEDQLLEEDFSSSDGVVIIRDNLVNEPLSLPGVYKLSYDPRQVLEGQGFFQIYASNTVSAYHEPDE